jgi:hypothetical protein
MHLRLCMQEHFHLIINPFKYKCETSHVFIHPFQKITVSVKCNSWVGDLTTFKLNDSIHMQMSLVQEMWKKSLNHSNINVRHYVLMCVSIYIYKCNMQCLNFFFNKLKINDPTHIKMLIVQEMWKKSLNHLV